ncbi:MAG: transporter [Tannerellaceae bacterium]|nr:transporter [Tannerellaceae bacterium]
MKTLKFIKDWALPIAMITGAVAYHPLSYCSFLTPHLIFLMLFVTFSKMSPREMCIHPAHFLLLGIQLFGSLAVYAAVNLYHPVVAQGAFICVIIPTATAAAVITGLLGGNVAFLASYVLLCNIAVAIAAPLLLPIIGHNESIPFWEAFFRICREVAPILLLPLLFAWLIRYMLPKVNAVILGIRNLTFYLWAVALAIVTSKMVKFFAEQENPDYAVELSLAAASLIICVAQFLVGRRIGKHYGDPVSSGQGLGQKNTILAMWMAQAYLNPISSVAPATYILWQNIINSYQLWRKNRISK